MKLNILDKIQVFEQVSGIELQLGQLYEQLEQLKGDLEGLLEENYRMSMENKHLRSYLDDQDIKRVKVNKDDQTDAKLPGEDRKSTRLNSSHVAISYAVFCLKKK